MIFKSFRGFSSLDFLTLVTSVTAVAVISGPIIQRGLQSERVGIATKEMRISASEIITRVAMAPKVELGRSPASASINAELPEGTLGTDPWGKSYHYRILRNSYGQPTHVLIWSAGPNGNVETPMGNLSEGGRQMASAVFEGDDVGVLMSAR